MDSSCLDPKRMMYSFLDPKNTMDYALFKKVRAVFMFDTVSRKSMIESVKTLVDLRNNHDELLLPQLDVILHKDLVEHAWGWDRLLPWMTGYCLFEDYFEYLGDYYGKNSAEAEINCGDLSSCLATKCIETEDAVYEATVMSYFFAEAQLVTSTRPHRALRKRIKSEADRIKTLGSASTVQATGFMCIMEEANLMLEVFKRNVVNADKYTIEMIQREFEFGYDIRSAALDILTKYKGPYCNEVSASLLGMQKEATEARKLLNQGGDFDSLSMCQDIRANLLRLLIIIRDYFPMDCGIEYPHKIGDARAAMEDRLKDLHLIKIGEVHENVDVGSNISGIPQTTVTAIINILG
ncbi:uncharacterized protein [Lolium perenne]|nr:uncharacterized protein LOC127338470 isoform X2 [Lolium perenne]